MDGQSHGMEPHERILRSPRFQELIRRRSAFAWTLSAIMLGLYFGFVLLVAFAKDLMAVRIGGGVTSLGILLGLGIIATAFVLTGVYVARANSRFDDLTRSLQEEVTR
ncbi:DUF485 domain-containing protein [Muricoccus vinaceus]|uniref:DUF485 domain-containing protein n=1 Tax=Muricoccus vinaceus TaxID=424704 RepID=A0ABV6J0H4_9PROT